MTYLPICHTQKIDFSVIYTWFSRVFSYKIVECTYSSYLKLIIILEILNALPGPVLDSDS